MDKNTKIGWALIITVLIGFAYFSQPNQEEIEAYQRQVENEKKEMRRDSINRVRQDSIARLEQAEQQIALAGDSSRAFFQHRVGEAKDIVLKNDKLELTINTKGGTPTKVRLLGKYKTWDKKDQVELLTPGQNEMVLSLDGKHEIFKTSDYYFTPVEMTDSSVVMRLSTIDGGCFDLCYSLREGSYMTDFSVRATGMEKHLALSNKKLNIEWNDTCRQQEKGHQFENRYATITYKEAGDDTDYLSASSEKEETLEKAIDWVAFKNQFFSCVLIGGETFTDVTLKSTPLDEKSGYLKKYHADMQTAFDPTGAKATEMQLYLGPNDFHLLQEHSEMSCNGKDLELEDLIDFGWPLFKWINRFFILYLFDWLTGWGLPMGMVLLLLTLLIKILVFPPTRKSFMSSARMRVLKPKIDELAKKYPNPEDAMKRQQEQMGLYQQYGVSPMGGCLPMLIQMPVWIALFNFVPNAIQLRGESFLWADDLSSYDELLRWNADIWPIGDHLSIFCLLFCATNVFNALISMRQQKDQMSSEQAQQMKMMQYMMLFMPVMFFFMFNNYASGLCYYYFLSGLINIFTMWYLRKNTDDAKLLAELEAYREAHKNEPRKLNSMMARMAALQEQQEQLKKMQQQKK